MIDLRTLRLSDLHGVARLGVEATAGLTDVVEAMHAAIARPHLGLRGAAPARTAGIAGLVYRGIRGTTRLAGTGLGLVLSRQDVAPLRTSAERQMVAQHPVQGRDHRLALGRSAQRRRLLPRQHQT